jgi:hypothetical protein
MSSSQYLKNDVQTSSPWSFLSQIEFLLYQSGQGLICLISRVIQDQLQLDLVEKLD